MKNFFKIFKNKFNKTDFSYKTNSHDHWKYLLNTFFLVTGILILLSFYLLYKIKNEEIFQAVPVKNNLPSLVNEKLLEKVNNYFNNKAQEEKQLNEKLFLYQDPSF